ncbi:hypothetical protein [Sporomusa malonica]|uniref:Uncharacterized protein n=1 Tax=Sporomusa malonica TaxID=112901 RepID=A0A1W2ASM0_9FIRM|nr:hypothetical protein [Sporomusa malonica]SMC63739.1 hypothetical protein SAMN04488500_10686 [Sporomusa malonica]
MPTEQKCGNCQHYGIDTEECALSEEWVLPTSWCLQHRMDWDKERGGK